MGPNKNVQPNTQYKNPKNPKHLKLPTPNGQPPSHRRRLGSEPPHEDTHHQNPKHRDAHKPTAIQPEVKKPPPQSTKQTDRQLPISEKNHLQSPHLVRAPADPDSRHTNVTVGYLLRMKPLSKNTSGSRQKTMNLHRLSLQNHWSLGTKLKAPNRANNVESVGSSSR